MRLTFVRDLADDLNDDVGVGALGVDIGDANFGVVVIKLLDSVVDRLLPFISQVET